MLIDTFKKLEETMHVHVSQGAFSLGYAEDLRRGF